MSKLKLQDKGNWDMRIGVNENTFIGYGNPYEKLHISGNGIVIGPHGEHCGCKWFDEQGNKLNYIGLGCQNPNTKLDINK